MIALFVTACVVASLHGEPATVCREIQLREYTNVAACDRAQDEAIASWLKALKEVNLNPKVISKRCGPAEADGDDI